MDKYLPYGRQFIDLEDINEVQKVLLSDWLTTGPKVEEFEQEICKTTGSKYAVAVSSGTAALHSSIYALNIADGDEVIVPTMTFAATANCIVYQGGTPVFVDINKDNLLIDPNLIEKNINKRTKAIIAVDYAGHPADYKSLQNIAKKNNISLISDSCHAIGGKYFDKRVGSISDLSTFSFHPVKHITTGEGGEITTNNRKYFSRLKNFRNHGITSDHRERAEKGSWFYEMDDLGYNYRISDFQCALGISQLKKLSKWIVRRQEIAELYDSAFKENDFIYPLQNSKNIYHAYHLYVVRIRFSEIKINRSKLFSFFKENSIGVNVHYIPVHLHPFYKRNYNTKEGDFPIAESLYEEIISLPIYPQMSDDDFQRVVTLLDIISKNEK